MKKNILLFMAVAAMLLNACKNEDITISREVTFEVNPYEVINKFVNNEIHTGDLEETPDGYKLRVNLFVYNSERKLCASETKYLNNYRETMNVSFELEDGNYVVVVTTDVVRYNGNVTFEFWEFSGMENLSDLKITDAGYIGSDTKILGVGHENISVRSGQSTCHVELEAAGSLVINLVYSIHQYNIIDSYCLMTKKSSNVCSFNHDGSYDTSYDERLNYSFYADKFYPSYYSSDVKNVYNYVFFFPYGKTDFVWRAEVSDGSTMDLTNNMSLTIGQGKAYYFMLDMKEGTYSYGEYYGSKCPAFGSTSMARNSHDADVEKSQK